jgi:hypothetical protein
VLAIVERIVGFLADKAKGLLKTLGIAEDDDEEVVEDTPEKTEKVRAGLAAIDIEEARVVENGKISHAEAVKVAGTVRADHPVFTRLEVVDGGDSWNYDWKASPGDIKDTPAKKEEGEGAGDIPDAVVKVPAPMSGEGHTLTAKTSGGSLEITMASRETIISVGLARSIREVKSMPHFAGRAEIIGRLETAQEKADYNELITDWRMMSKEGGKNLPRGVNNWPTYMAYRLSEIVTELHDLAVGTRKITHLGEMFRQLNRGNGKYSNLVDPVDVAPFKEFTDAQRAVILAVNAGRNNNVILDDETGAPLDDTKPVGHHLKPNIDHIYPRALGGSNSYSNANVIGAGANIAKGITVVSGSTPFGTPAGAVGAGPVKSTPPIRRRPVKSPP